MVGCRDGFCVSYPAATELYTLPLHGALRLLARAVRLVDGGELAKAIADVVVGWPFRGAPVSGAEPVITLTKTEKGYQRVSPWLTKPAAYPDKVDAVCDFIVDLINAYIADDPRLLCLHCAAIEFEYGLVVFPNPYKAGKSIHIGTASVRERG